MMCLSYTYFKDDIGDEWTSRCV